MKLYIKIQIFNSVFIPMTVFVSHDTLSLPEDIKSGVVYFTKKKSTFSGRRTRMSSCLRVLQNSSISACAFSRCSAGKDLPPYFSKKSQFFSSVQACNLWHFHCRCPYAIVYRLNGQITMCNPSGVESCGSSCSCDSKRWRSVYMRT